MGKRYSVAVAAIAAMGLVLSACGGDDGGTDGDTAAGCSPDSIAGYALRAPGPDRVDVSDAQPVAKVVRGQAKETVKIGMFGDLTGGNSSLVIHLRDAAKLAIEQRNAVGDLNVKVQFVARDNKDASEETAPAIEQSFIDDEQVVAVIGGAFSGETLAVGNLFDRAGLVHVSASATNPDITTKGWPFFRALNTDEVQGAKVAELLDNIGCTKVAVVDDKSDYGAGLAKFVRGALRDLGAEVALTEGIEPTTDYSALVASLQSEQPDALFYGGYVKDFSLIVKQIREAGLTDMLLMSGDGSKEQPLIDQAGADNAEGVILSCPCLDPNVSSDPAAQKFAQDFEAEYGRKTGIYGAEGWDVANMLLEGIAANDDDGSITREEMLTYMQEDVNGFEGLTKTFEFDETGEVAGGIVLIYAVKDGAIALLGEVGEVT